MHAAVIDNNLWGWKGLKMKFFHTLPFFPSYSCQVNFYSFPSLHLIKELRTCLSLFKMSTPFNFILSMKNWLSGWSPCTTAMCKNLWRTEERIFYTSSLLRQGRWKIKIECEFKRCQKIRFYFRMSFHLEGIMKLGHVLKIRPELLPSLIKYLISAARTI